MPIRNLSALVAALLIASCQPAADETIEEPTQSTIDLDARLEARGNQTKPFERASLHHELDANAQPMPVASEVPEPVMRMVYNAFTKLTGKPAEPYELKVALAKQWPNGALGCPVVGMMYTQAIVSGYHVVFEQGGKEYDFRTKGDSYVMLCLEPSNVGSGETAPVR